MRIAIVHNEVNAQDDPDARDVLVQVETVTAALVRLGHEIECLQCSLDLSAIKKQLGALSPGLVFNLVESLDGKGRLIHLFPFLLDAMNIPYTGSPASSILATSSKIAAKKQMVMAGLPTPAWRGMEDRQEEHPDYASPSVWIVKSVWEHASIGLDAGSLVETDFPRNLHAVMEERASSLGGECFAEAFIPGREFNLSILAGPNGPEVLPPAEILFHGFGETKPRIVDYRAKWDEDSFEYINTPRRFEFGPEDTSLLDRLTSLALSCWHVFDLGGYGRVDFRVDDDGRPWILEVNANPCLSPDAGFVAALARAGIEIPQAIEKILRDALSRCGSTSTGG